MGSSCSLNVVMPLKCLIFMFFIGWMGLSFASGDDIIRFSRDILPLLSEHCLACHGPDEGHRKAELRLDTQEGMFSLASSGKAIVDPGRPDKSELIDRLFTNDPDSRMPPVQHGDPLSVEARRLFKSWVEQGAQWGKHWAFERPRKSILPHSVEHPIDFFVRERLNREGMDFSSQAENATLIRRLSLDLTGLPPDPEELRQFEADPSDEAYRRWVNHYLSSQHFGERMAMWWLDAARYADTDGFQQDATRTNWPWRDWVIEAFNQNMPYDEFTVAQMAGDLLPNASAEDVLATSFHRNHMTNGEGGRDPEESRVDYVIDRVNTTGTLWLGLTVGCAQCHTHKFDPISHKEYYSLSAFFNDIDEDGRAGKGAKPYMSYQSPYAARALKEAEIYFNKQGLLRERTLEQSQIPFETWLNARVEESRNGFQAWRPVSVLELDSVEGTEFIEEEKGIIQTKGPLPRQDDYIITSSTSIGLMTGFQLEIFPHTQHTEGKLSRGKTGEFIVTNIKLQVRSKGSLQLRDIAIASAMANAEGESSNGERYGKIRDTLDDDPRTGWTTRGQNSSQAYRGVFALEEPLELTEGEELLFVLMHRSTLGDANIGRFRISVTDQPGEAVRSLEAMPMEELTRLEIQDIAEIKGSLRDRLFQQFLETYRPYHPVRDRFTRAKQHVDEMKKGAEPVDVMVLKDRAEPRDTHILIRGVWDQKGPEVEPGILSSVLDQQWDRRMTRLDLARWIVSEDNPLTARVMVNHLWQLLFGAGLVRTPDDFGLQGEQPTHPELLDWLAVEFMESGWDIKHMVKWIVTSRTYRQDSGVTPRLMQVDPDNRLLARGARYRLPSWMIHDYALKVSGLLNPSIGGPPVKPHQPSGLWKENFMGRFTYDPSPGTARYRRTLYAFWRRASAPAFLFDNAQRRVCEVRPLRTNTPLQALTLLNDQTLLEASHVLAGHALLIADELEKCIQWMSKAILARDLSRTELSELTVFWERAESHYEGHPSDAFKLLEIGQMKSNMNLDPAEHVAGMLTASLLFNLDEAITHE